MADVNVNTTMTVDLMPKLLAALQELDVREVLVGVPADEAWRDKNTAANEDPDNVPINNAALAYIHNYGAPDVGIPPRPFLVQGVLNVKDQIVGRLRIAARAATGPRAESIDQTLTAVGLIAQAAVRKKITDGPFTPLKPATIARRDRKKRTAAQRKAVHTVLQIRPLIDTGQLRHSINFAIRDRE